MPKYDVSSSDSAYDSDDISNISTNSDKEEFVIHQKTTFWIYKLSSNYWEQLSKLFKKKKIYISSFGAHKLLKHDIVLIYQKHASAFKNGFVAMCQICSDMIQNTENIKIFNDSNMNKYYCEVNIACIFETQYKLTYISKTLKEKGKIFNFASIKKICTGDYLYTRIDLTTGTNIISVLNDDIKTPIKNKFKSDSKSSELSSDSSGSDDSSDTKSEYSSQSLSSSDDDEILVVRGHIPIMMIPCNEFRWDLNPDISIKNFKKHYSMCNTCEKIDNNNCTLFPFFDKAEIFCKELKDDDKLKKYLEYYYNLKNYTFELMDNDKKYDHVYLHRINNRGHIYHRCILIIW